MQHLSIYTTNREANLPLLHADSLLLFYICHNYVFAFKRVKGHRDNGGLSKLHQTVP